MYISKNEKRTEVKKGNKKSLLPRTKYEGGHPKNRFKYNLENGFRITYNPIALNLYINRPSKDRLYYILNL